MIITFIGLGKVHSASAATLETSVTIPWGDSEVTIELGDYDYYLIVYDASGTEGYADVILSESPAVVNEGLDIVVFGYGCRFSKESYSTEPVEQKNTNGLQIGYRGRWSSLRSNYDVLKDGTTEVYSPSNPFIKPNVFSMEAPYFRFDSLYIRNRVYNGETGLGLKKDEIYTELTAESVWTYNGIVENLDAYPNAEYYIDLNFTLHLPTIDWLNQKYTDTTESAIEYVKWTIDIIDEWYLDASVPKYSYNISMPIPIEPTADGHFSFTFTFNELLTYIRYYYPDAKELINSLPVSTQGVFISYVCVESLRGSVVTKTGSQNIYGRFTHNEFVRGDIKTCLEVIPNENYYDMSEDEFDQYFDDIYKEAHGDYLIQLQDRIDDLQNQIDSMQSIDGAFGDLGASDLWSGFVGTVKGISQMAVSVGALSLAIGSVFSFLPMQIGAYMGFTLLAILVIAIIKAIRG